MTYTDGAPTRPPGIVAAAHLRANRHVRLLKESTT